MRRRGLIHGVEVQPRCAAFEQVAAEFQDDFVAEAL